MASSAPIAVVIPVLDEAAALPWVLDRMPAGHVPIVVDNGSTDGSRAVAAAHGATVVTEPERGFGAACRAGLLEAAAVGADIVCFMDGDASLDPQDLHLVGGPVVAGSADLMLGARAAAPGAWPRHARAANRFLAAHVRRRFGAALTDIGPMRAAPVAGLLDLGIADRRFGWPLEMVARAAAAGWRIDETPIAYHPRIGDSKVTGTLLGTVRAVRDMTAVLRTVAA